MALRGRWAVDAAKRICSECNPLLCERLAGDVEAVCIWIGPGSDTVKRCAERLCGDADCIPVDVWLFGDERFEACEGPLPYWLIVESVGFLSLEALRKRAPGATDPLATPTLLGNLVFIRGCANTARELTRYIEHVESMQSVIAWSLYLVTGRICGKRVPI